MNDSNNAVRDSFPIVVAALERLFDSGTLQSNKESTMKKTSYYKWWSREALMAVPGKERDSKAAPFLTSRLVTQLSALIDRGCDGGCCRRAALLG